MKPFTDFTSTISESVEKADAVKAAFDAVAKTMSSKGMFAIVTKGALGGGSGKETWFLTVLGPKDTWPNKISQNDPVQVHFVGHYGDPKVEMLRMGYQLKNEGTKKFRKAAFKDSKDLEKKLMKWFDTNAANMDAVLAANENK